MHYVSGNARFLAPGPLTTASTSRGRPAGQSSRPAVVSVAIRDSDDRVRTRRQMLARGGDDGLAIRQTDSRRRKAQPLTIGQDTSRVRGQGVPSTRLTPPGRAGLKAPRKPCVSGHWQPLDWQSPPPRGRPIDPSGRIHLLVARSAPTDGQDDCFGGVGRTALRSVPGVAFEPSGRLPVSRGSGAEDGNITTVQ